MKFDLNLELALLPPGHAHNLTDAFFARNELFDNVKQSSRLVAPTLTHIFCSKVRIYCQFVSRACLSLSFTQQRTPP